MVADVATRVQGTADVHVVWLPVLRSDTPETASEASADLAPAPLRAWWLSNNNPAEAFAPAIGLQRNHLAWDIVLVYGPDARWEGSTPPTPAAWWHQLGGEDPTRKMGPDLEARLLEAVNGLKAR